MTEEEFGLRQRLVRVGKLIWDEGLTGTHSMYLSGGNISTRIPGTDKILIKPSGFALGKLKAEDFVVVNLHGKVISEKGRPSSETSMHTKIYRTRSDVGGICHTHSTFCSVFGIVGIDLKPLWYGGSALQLLKGVPVLRYKQGGTQELADVVAEALKDRVAVLLEFHGAVTVGKTIEMAYHFASKIEELAGLQWLAMQIGTPRTLPENIRKKILESAKKLGGI